MKNKYPSEYMSNIAFDVIDWIDDNINKYITVEDVSKKSGYSVRHIQYIFRAVTGESLGRFIRIRKMSKAAESLVTTNRSITSICTDVGYVEPTSFNRLFKSVYRVTPTQYREGYRDGR